MKQADGGRWRATYLIHSERPNPIWPFDLDGGANERTPKCHARHELNSIIAAGLARYQHSDAARGRKGKGEKRRGKGTPGENLIGLFRSMDVSLLCLTGLILAAVRPSKGGERDQ